MTRRRELMFSIAVPIATVIIVLCLAEIVLHFLPVSTGLRSLPVTAENPVFHFTPNRTYVSSFGWDMHNVNRGRVNNAGFVNEQDYQRENELPLIAVIGDSFIEGQMVPYAETMQGRLARALAGQFRVYSFAASGAPLSQYLIWARHAVQFYGARAVVINVVSNDFDESHADHKVAPGFWLYAPDADGVLRLRLTEHRPGWLIALVRHSALGRYVVINLKVQQVIFGVRAIAELFFGKPARAEPLLVGATDPTTDRVRVRDSFAAINAFFRDLPEMVGLPPDNIMFTVDGFRYRVAQEAGRGTYFDLMRRAVLEKARQKGYEAVDLDDLFIPRHERTGENFEFADDSHWSGIGHGVAAEAVMSSKLLAHLRQ